MRSAKTSFCVQHWQTKINININRPQAGFFLPLDIMEKQFEKYTEVPGLFVDLTLTGRCAPPDRETGPVAAIETLYKVSQGLDPDKVGPANMCYWDQIMGKISKPAQRWITNIRMRIATSTAAMAGQGLAVTTSGLQSPILILLCGHETSIREHVQVV